MGGKGLRFGSPFPKQFHKVGGKPLYLHTLKAFLQVNEFERIILPTPKEYLDEVRKEVTSLYPNENIQVILGGDTRQTSSYLALQACPLDTDYVVIHDAVRPFVSKKIIQENLKAVKVHKAVDTCIPSTDTLVHSKENHLIHEIPPRNEFLRGQTPQSFAYDLILKAHEDALLENVDNSSDDCALALKAGHPIKIVLGDEQNIKITTDFDLFLAEQILYRPQLELDFLESSLEGKLFAITGASGGIGKALCHHLKSLGATLIEISQHSSPWKADLTKYQEVEDLFKKISQEFGPIDGLINGAGTLQVKAFDKLSYKEIKESVDANLMSTIYCCKCAELKKGGHIINISSSSYSKGRKDYLIYSASKAAIVNFTQGLAEEKPDLYINAVVPQRTDTSLRKAHFPEEDKASLIQPEEIANKISSLLKSVSCTGTILEVRKCLN
jgi:ribitol-5-phosphate 2-dehydrogenase (NADP+) / D-ribitol-5-phosphate cytidylyltransferase